MRSGISPCDRRSERSYAQSRPRSRSKSLLRSRRSALMAGMTREGAQAYRKSQMVCRADCGKHNPTFKYSKCKTARGVNCISHCDHVDTVVHASYCTEEDWKVRRWVF